jgi:hypothetical protein
MKDFFSQKWVQITAWCFIIAGTLVLLLGGVAAGEIAKVPALVAGIIEAIGILVVFIKKMITLKDTASK